MMRIIVIALVILLVAGASAAYWLKDCSSYLGSGGGVAQISTCGRIKLWLGIAQKTDGRFSFPEDDFTFSYPQIPNWEVKDIRKDSGTYYLYHAWPRSIDFELAPQTTVEVLSTSTLHQVSDVSDQFGSPFAYVFDSSLFADGYTPHKGQWTSIEFYSTKNKYGRKDEVVRITPFRYDGQGFDSSRFSDAIVQSFMFTAGILY